MAPKFCTKSVQFEARVRLSLKRKIVAMCPALGEGFLYNKTKEELEPLFNALRYGIVKQ
jgi:hypothetical protein